MTNETRSTVEILKAARERISDPSKWCQGRAAIEDRACATQAFNEQATTSTPVGSAAWTCILQAADGMGFPIPSHLNDQTDHPTVMAMYDQAIVLAEARS